MNPTISPETHPILSRHYLPRQAAALSSPKTRTISCPDCGIEITITRKGPGCPPLAALRCACPQPHINN